MKNNKNNITNLNTNSEEKGLNNEEWCQRCLWMNRYEGLKEWLNAEFEAKPDIFEMIDQLSFRYSWEKKIPNVKWFQETFKNKELWNLRYMEVDELRDECPGTNVMPPEFL